MIPAGIVPDHFLSAFHRRFPVRQHLWAGSMRLWRVALAVDDPSPSLLADWLARAANPLGLGLPAALVTSIRAKRTVRQSLAFLDLPAGPLAIPVPSQTFDVWPEPILAVPSQVLRPVGADLVPFASDWRRVPVVRAEVVPTIAVQVGEAIDVFVADAEGPAMGSVPVESFPIASPDDWAGAWRAWTAERSLTLSDPQRSQGDNGVFHVEGIDPALGEVWLCAGGGLMREAGLILPMT